MTRWTAASIGLSVAIAGNLFQLVVGLLRGTQTESSIITHYSSFNPQGIHFFLEYCERQAALLQSDDVVIVGILPMFFAEAVVLAIGATFCFLVLRVTRSFKLPRAQIFQGLAISCGLLALDQGRYIYTSIYDPEKLFFTWSSYCIHGTWGWFWDFIGYLGFYILLALAISSYLTALKNFKAIDWNQTPKSHSKPIEPLVALDATLTWLTYFAYAYLLIWLVFSGITPDASKIYAAQVFVIFGVIFAFFFVTTLALAQAYLRIEALRKYATPNPISELYAPHGTRVVEIFVKLSLPAILFLSVWFDWLKSLLSFLQS